MIKFYGREAEKYKALVEQGLRKGLKHYEATTYAALQVLRERG